METSRIIGVYRRRNRSGVYFVTVVASFEKRVMTRPRIERQSKGLSGEDAWDPRSVYFVFDV